MQLRTSSRKDDHYEVVTNKGTFETKIVVNAAGVYADTLHNMVSEDKKHIIARRGEYLLMDKELGDYFSEQYSHFLVRWVKVSSVHLQSTAICS